MKSTRLFIILSLLFCAIHAQSQMRIAGIGSGPAKAFRIYTEALTTIYVNDTLTGDPLVGSVVTIISSKDTLNISTYALNFMTYKFAVGELDREYKEPVQVTASYLGYKTFSKTYQPEEIGKSLDILMTEDPAEIATISVIGNRIAMIMRGDTTVYDAAAFNTMAGDKLGELLKQLPGVSVDENGIYANGKKVNRVYVDGQRFFGDDTMLALRDLTTDDIKNVKVYEEENPDAKRIGDKTAEKDQVMDVVTYSKPKVIKNIMLNLAGGTSTNKEESSGEIEDHLVGTLIASINKPSTSYSISGLGQTNGTSTNSTDYSQSPSITPSRAAEIHGSYAYRQGDSLSLTLGAHYIHGDAETKSTQQISYFPTELYELRQLDNITENMQNSDAYSGSATLNMGIRKTVLNVSLGANYSTYQNQSSTQTLDITDDVSLYQNQRTTSDGSKKGINAKVIYMGALFENTNFVFTADANLGENNSEGWRIDDDQSSSFNTVLSNNGLGSSRDLGASLRLSRSISERSSMNIKYSLGSKYNSSEQMAIDFLNNPEGDIDPTNTYDYTIDQSSNNLNLGYTYNAPKFLMSSSLTGDITKINRQEMYGDEYSMDHDFYSLSPMVQMTWTLEGNARINLNASSRRNNVSVEQLRDVISDQNPMFLRVGNIDLEQPNSLNASIGFNKIIAKRSLSVGVDFAANYVKDYIATKTTYFTEDTDLEQYDYTATAGASLTSYENVDGYYTLSSTLKFDKRFSGISSTLKANLKYSYANVPFFLQEQLRETTQHDMDLTLNLVAGFSKYFKPEIYSKTRVGIFTSGPYGSSKYIEQQLSGVIRTSFAKRYTANTMLTYNMYRNDVSSLSNRDDMFWNADITRSFGAQNRLKLGLMVFDILNSAQNKNVNITDDYITTSTQSILGRYWLLTLSYMF